MPRFAPAVILVLAAALALSGCGRKGKLEPPPEQQLTKGPEGKTRDPGPEKPHKPFVLDPLLN